MAVPRRVMEWSRDFIVEFIEAYKGLPCLWKVTSPEYKDRDKRSHAYGVLVERGRKVTPDLTVECVKAKINTLRTQFRKELTKVRAVSGTDYEPRLWCYSQLAFLADEEGMKESAPTTYRAVLGSDEETTNSLAESVQFDVECTPTIEDILPSLSSVKDVPPPSARAPQARKRPRPDQLVEDQLIAYAMKRLASDDEFDNFGRVVAAQLRRLDADQTTFARKIINDALYEGQLNRLDHNSRIVASLERGEGGSPD